MSMQEKAVISDLWASVSVSGFWQENFILFLVPINKLCSDLSTQTAVLFAPDTYIYLLSLSHLAVNTSKKRTMSSPFIITAHKN